MTPTPRTVWVVDDSPTDAERARHALRPQHQVEIFSEGAAALERLATGTQPDVMVLDWVMPGISGIEVCRFLRGPNSTYRAMKILLLTAQRETGHIVEGLAAGADDYLAKPYAEAEMAARVGALIRSKEALERAERAELVSRGLLEGSPDALIASDHDSRRISFVNAAAAAAFGKPPHELVGRTLDDVLPGLADRWALLSRGEFETLPDVTLGEKVFSPTGRNVPSPEGPLTIVSMRDVTRRRREDSRRLDFYSIIAHDLRSPLGAVLMRTGMIAQGRHGPVSPGLLGDIRRIDDNIRSMVSLINDFLDLARLENAGFTISREPVDLRAIAVKMLEDVRPLFDAAGLDARLLAADSPMWVSGDERRLTQVLQNLIGNAVKFTPRGGRVRVEVADRDGMIRVSVVDTGRGVSPEAVPRLFERYTRVEETSSAGGTGLGLMIVREIVEAHGGQVGVESTPDVGSTFWFAVPRAPAPAPSR